MKNTSKVLGSQSHWLCAAAIIAAIGLMFLPLTGCDTPDKGPETVATPTATPGQGAVASGTSVILTTTTAGADIWYTTNGNAPAKDGTGSTKYATAITITAATTIKAIAVKDGMTDSGILTAMYTIQTGSGSGSGSGSGTGTGGSSSVNAIELTMGKWANGNITTAGGEQWFKFTTGATQTSVYMHFLATGTLTDVYAQIYKADSTTTEGNRANLNTGLWAFVSRTGLTANTDYYIKVTPYSSTKNGTYKIGVVSATSSSTIPSLTSVPTASAVALTANAWTDQTLATAYSEKWFKFNSSGTSQYLFFEPGTQQNLYAQVYAGDGTSVGGTTSFGNSTLSASLTGLTASTDYYIMVFHSSTGTYQIGLNTTSTPPVITVPTSSATALPADTWKDGNITSTIGENWFKISATAASHYFHKQPETSTGVLSDIIIRLYTADGAMVGTTLNLDNTILGFSRKYDGLTASTEYYVRVKAYSSYSNTGTYKIGFNNAAETPVVSDSVPPSSGVTSMTAADTWVNGNIATANGTQWFKFTASVSGSTSQYIYFNPGTLTNVYALVYTNDGRITGNNLIYYPLSKYDRATGLANGTTYYREPLKT